MKIHEAAELALREIGQPTHLRALREYIEQRGYFHFGALSPETALGVQLSRYGRGSVVGRRPTGEEIFYRAAPATYGLLKWLTIEEQQSIEVDASVTNAVEMAELDASLFLERELHDWLYKNLEANGLQALGFGNLRMYEPETQGNRAGKYLTEGVGEIDMLLITPNEDLLIIELKRRSNDTSLGQICRYFGYVKRHLCREGQKVYGLILAQEVSNSLRYALTAVDSAITAKTISFQISVGDAITGP